MPVRGHRTMTSSKGNTNLLLLGRQQLRTEWTEHQSGDQNRWRKTRQRKHRGDEQCKRSCDCEQSLVFSY